MRSGTEPTSTDVLSDAIGQTPSNACPSSTATKSASTSVVSKPARSAPAKRKPGIHKRKHPWHGISLSHKESAAAPPFHSRLVKR